MMLSKYLGISIVFLAFFANFLYPFDFAGVHKLREPLVKEKPENLNFQFQEVAKSLGVDFSYEAPAVADDFQPITIYLPAGGVAVADVNNDSWMDFYLVTSKTDSPNHLYINNSGKGFSEVAGQWGIANVNVANTTGRIFASVSPSFFDYNNDGKVDLFIAGVGCAKLFKNTGNSFVDVSAESLVDCNNSFGATPLDYNNDGFLDLYLYRYQSDYDLFQATDRTVWVDNIVDARNGGNNSLYRNNQDGTFTDVTEEVGGGDPHWSLDAGVGYFTNAEHLELLVANDYGPDKLFQIKDNQLIDESKQLGFPDRRAGMGVTSGYVDNKPLPLVHVSNIFYPGYTHEGNFLWDFNDGKSDLAHQKGTNNCLWSWGAVFADFDLDGDLDLYVSNGFISGEYSDYDYESYAFEEKLRDASFEFSILRTLPGFLTRNLNVMRGLVKQGVNGDIDYAGHQNDCFFWNNNQEFKNVAKFIGFDEKWDGRGVATIDYDNNGILDLLITTRNKGAKFFRNTKEASTNWIGITLESNQSLVGTIVEVTQNKKQWKRMFSAGKNGYLAFSDPRIHVGLIDSSPVSVEVTWPDKTLKKIGKLEPGLYHSINKD